MSDERRDDWTQGPELSREEVERRRAAASSRDDEPTDADSVRLAEVQMMDRWIGGVLKEQR